MCMTLYLATTRPVNPVVWEEARPAFNIQPLSETEEPVVAQFSKPSVVFVGSHTGCSCGFGYCMQGDPPPEAPELETPDDVAEHQSTQASMAALRAFLTDCLSDEPTVELFACWSGDEGAKPEARVEVTPEHFSGDSVRLVEKTFYVVHLSRITRACN
jgi:hypothetical protein